MVDANRLDRAVRLARLRFPTFPRISLPVFKQFVREVEWAYRYNLGLSRP